MNLELKYTETVLQDGKPCPELRPSQPLCYNPVEEHLIELRKCFQDVNLAKRKAKKELAKLKRGEGPTYIIKIEKPIKKIVYKRGKRKTKILNVVSKPKPLELPTLSVPKHPEHYPFVKSVNERLKNRQNPPRVKFQGVLKEKSVAGLLQQFVRSVLVQNGYSMPASKQSRAALNFLADVADRFLKTFVFRMARYRNAVLEENEELEGILNNDEGQSSKDDTYLWGVIETTLREYGSGIHELHRFYYEKIVKKHDRMVKICKRNLTQYNRTKAECQSYLNK